MSHQIASDFSTTLPYSPSHVIFINSDIQKFQRNKQHIAGTFRFMLALIIEIKCLRIRYHWITCSRIKYSRNKCPRITCVSIRCTGITCLRIKGPSIKCHRINCISIRCPRIFLGFFGLIKELFVGQDCI